MKNSWLAAIAIGLMLAVVVVLWPVFVLVLHWYRHLEFARP